MKNVPYYTLTMSVFAVGLTVCGIVMLGVAYCDSWCAIPIGLYLIIGGGALHLWLGRRAFFPWTGLRKVPGEEQLSDNSGDRKTAVGERMLSSVIEAAPMAMLVVSQEGHIVLVNKAIEALFGWSNEELIGQKVEMLVPNGLRVGHLKLHEFLSKEGSSGAIGIGREINGQRRDKSQFTAEIGLSSFETVDGVNVIATVLDTTSLLERSRLLCESEERLSLALSGSGEGLWDWEIRKGTFFWSSEYAELLGVDRYKLMPEVDLFEQRLHPEDRDEVLVARKKHLDDGELFNVDCRLQKEDGSYVWINARGCTFRDDVGRPIRMSGTVRDISSRKRAENELKTSMAELSHANKELQDFAYITSHDLREPLRTIASFMQLLKADYGEQLDKDANEYMDFAVSASKRLQEMILGLMAYNQVDVEERAYAPLPLSNPISTAVRELQARIEKTGTTIDIQDGFPAVNGNAAQLTQLFQNLITNAIKFQETGAPHIQITHKTGLGANVADLLRADRSYCVVSVKDNGIGVASEQQQRVFSMFQRLHATGKFEGIGIGLALCSKIVTRHNGLVWIDSEEGEGSVFHVALPLAGQDG